MDFSNMTLAEVLRAYSLVKGHRTRCEREINSLIDMLKVQYSAPSEVRINDRLEKLEKHTHKLSDITDYLITAKYAKAKDHSEEVAEFFTTLGEDLYFNNHAGPTNGIPRRGRPLGLQ